MTAPITPDEPCSITTDTAPSPASPAQIQINDADSEAAYANFCRISGTPEQLLIDFGLNPQPIGTLQLGLLLRRVLLGRLHLALLSSGRAISWMFVVVG